MFLCICTLLTLVLLKPASYKIPTEPNRIYLSVLQIVGRIASEILTGSASKCKG